MLWLGGITVLVAFLSEFLTGSIEEVCVCARVCVCGVCGVWRMRALCCVCGWTGAWSGVAWRGVAWCGVVWRGACWRRLARTPHALHGHVHTCHARRLCCMRTPRARARPLGLTSAGQQRMGPVAQLPGLYRAAHRRQRVRAHHRRVCGREEQDGPRARRGHRQQCAGARVLRVSGRGGGVRCVCATACVCRCVGARVCVCVCLSCARSGGACIASLPTAWSTLMLARRWLPALPAHTHTPTDWPVCHPVCDHRGLGDGAPLQPGL
jgi:hypothetical protein